MGDLPTVPLLIMVQAKAQIQAGWSHAHDPNAEEDVPAVIGLAPRAAPDMSTHLTTPAICPS